MENIFKDIPLDALIKKQTHVNENLMNLLKTLKDNKVLLDIY